MGQWQLQDAKARLSEVIKSAHDEGPQLVTVRGKPSAVVISFEEYKAMKKQRPGFVEFMRSSPLVGVELSDSPVRGISL
ncbi:type II toxin-antitoxin system Phd/YefM family antitoxin [Mariprofundus sp. EBB-1]|uniref:type II toxin-antitoxin system Phd/YefM family antitoxin n=1 Tax=Mariprofundus sp. EBB-1 TaxID=2650971 RepID=UPI000EF1C914|nr:type II toxin-antitoxin system Phd/YefM family antitoxin [Mariprofundus sp. EBB-1]RLL50941.1 type II toxin-antitoxin system Phd/YefM family antitoxin [Mariprofundus sp. EBB-1]